MKNHLNSLVLAVCCAVSCTAGEVVALKDVFPFKIGTCLNSWQFSRPSPDMEKLIVGTFNTCTPENELKPISVQPREGQWRFEAGDRFVAFAEKHQMKPIGHCLVWHSQTGDWMFKDGQGNPASRELVVKRMKEHIYKVVGRYKGRIKGWDVVNESFGGNGRLHRSPWLDRVGPDFMELAFTFAHEADPDCELYYNDYGMDNPRKRDGVVKMIRDFKKKGIRIDGIGMQSHHHLRSPSLKDYEDSIAAFEAEGVKVMITELDISVLPSAWGATAEISTSHEYKKKYDPYTEGLPEAQQKQLADRYIELFKIYRRHEKAIDRVTFWGFSDRFSWLNGFPVRGRTDYPLLYDRQLKPKLCAKFLYDFGKGGGDAAKGVDLFQSGTKFQDSLVRFYRIPAICRTNKGTLIALVDKRPDSVGDLNYHQPTRIAMRRSFDNGATWTEMSIIHDLPWNADEQMNASDPSLIVDRTTGRVFCFWNAWEWVKDKGHYRFFVQQTDDDGATWSKPEEITRQIYRPEWGGKPFVFISSGHGEQLKDGTLMHTTVWVSKHQVGLFGSDDHGKTWKPFGSLAGPGDECKFMELKDGSWMINTRLPGGKNRGIHLSQDKGATWKTHNDETLADPACNAGLLRLSDGRLAFSNCNVPQGPRRNVCVRTSADDGKTWSEPVVVDAGFGEYSDLVELANGEVGIIYEQCPGYRSIRFVNLGRLP